MNFNFTVSYALLEFLLHTAAMLFYFLSAYSLFIGDDDQVFVFLISLMLGVSLTALGANL